MTYEETVQYLYDSTPVFEQVGAPAYKEGLSNSLALDEHFGHPHRQFQAIHIAGTNGKGSCAHTIAAVLQAAGKKVGLYTSPHIVDFRERIRVNGEMISKQYVIDFVEQEHPFFEPLHPSFFELTTALAFKYFADKQVDVAVIEVGLGGRLDCTNIITPTLSVITNISFDHTQFLGDSLAKIAGEKAGIIKQGIPVVIGETRPETKPVFSAKAKEMNAPIIFAEAYKEVISSDPDKKGGRLYHTKRFGLLNGELGGIYQEKNTNTVLCALKTMGLTDETAIRNGFQNVCESTGLIGRWQCVHDKPLAICDTGHNAGGWAYLSEQIKKQPCKHLRIVFGMVDDKDIDTIMDMLPRNAMYYWAQASTKRSFPVDVIYNKGVNHTLQGRPFATVQEAYETALAEASKDDFIFIGGSSYIVSDLLAKV